MPDLTIFFGDNLPVLQALPAATVDLIYIDPPFNTGTVQSRTRLATIRDEQGDRTGFQGKRYRTVRLGTLDDCIEAALTGSAPPRLPSWHAGAA